MKNTLKSQYPQFRHATERQIAIVVRAKKRADKIVRDRMAQSYSAAFISTFQRR